MCARRRTSDTTFILCRLPATPQHAEASANTTRPVHGKAAHKGRLHARAQVKSGTIFDNVLVTDDAHYAEAFANATWGVTKDKEVEMFNALAKQKADEAEAKRKEARTCARDEPGSL